MHQIDLLDARLTELAGFAERIAHLLAKPDAKSNDALVASLDELLAAIYALVSAVETGFRNRTGPGEFESLTRARHLASGLVRRDGNWMAAFHFDDALFRIAAVFDWLPKALGGTKAARDKYLDKTRKPWHDKDAHDIREQVAALRHDALGSLKGHSADLPDALSAVKELLELAETLS